MYMISIYVRQNEIGSKKLVYLFIQHLYSALFTNTRALILEVSFTTLLHDYSINQP